MITYLVCDLTERKHYVGSTTTSTRPFEHLKGPSHENWQIHRAKKRAHKFFVFVSEDDNLDDRSEEQFYLDFYHGTDWSLNVNPNATGNPQAIRDYNEKVKLGLLPPSGLDGGWQNPTTNLARLANGTHNLLAANRDKEVEKRRIEIVKKALTGENNPAKRPEVRAVLKEVCKGKGFWKNKLTGEVRRFVEAPSEEWEVADRSWWVNKNGKKHCGTPPDVENWQRGWKWSE